MAITGYRYVCKLTIDMTKLTADVVDFPVLLTKDNLPAQIYNILSGGALEGGGDIRFSTDATGDTQIPCQIVSFIRATPDIEVWTKLNVSSALNTSFYVFWGKVDDTQPVASNTYGANNVWNGNFKGVWHLQESGDGTADEFKDSTSGAHHGIGGGGSSTATPTRTTGKIGYAQSFVTDDWIRINDSTDWNVGTGNMSIEAWVWINAGGDTTWNGIASHTSTDVSDGWWFDRHPQSGGRFTQFTLADTDTLGTTAITTGSWFHVAATKTGTTITHYVNGGAAGATVLGNITDSPGYFKIGNEGSVYGNQYMNGLIEEVRFSNTNRSAGWITATYNNTNAPNTFLTAGTVNFLRNIEHFVHHGLSRGIQRRIG